VSALGIAQVCSFFLKAVAPAPSCTGTLCDGQDWICRSRALVRPLNSICEKTERGEGSNGLS
jgi:hypothetical protein